MLQYPGVRVPMMLLHTSQGPLSFDLTGGIVPIDHLTLLSSFLYIARFTLQTYNLFVPDKPKRRLQCTVIKLTGDKSTACRYVTLPICVK